MLIDIIEKDKVGLNFLSLFAMLLDVYLLNGWMNFMFLLRFLIFPPVLNVPFGCAMM